MKSIRLGVLGLLMIGYLGSCDNNVVERGFEMSYIEDFEIFAGLNTVETHIFEFNITSNFQDYLTQHGVTADDVETIVPKYIRMTSLSGNQEYNILNRARLFISKLDGTLEYETAYREPVPLNTLYQLDLIPTLAEVTEQLSENRFKARLKLNFSQIPPQSIDTRMVLTFQVVLKEE